MDETPERLIASLTGPAAPPRKNGELVFEAPWQARVFGVVEAIDERQYCDRQELRQRLIAALGELDGPAEPGRYYELWLASLEALLLDEGLLTRAEIDERLAEISSREQHGEH
jgi:nitrile hydratase accessory protein